MTPALLQHIQELYLSARERDPSVRPGFLDQACDRGLHTVSVTNEFARLIPLRQHLQSSLIVPRTGVQ